MYIQRYLENLGLEMCIYIGKGKWLKKHIQPIEEDNLKLKGVQRKSVKATRTTMTILFLLYKYLQPITADKSWQHHFQYINISLP